MANEAKDMTGRRVCCGGFIVFPSVSLAAEYMVGLGYAESARIASDLICAGIARGTAACGHTWSDAGKGDLEGAL